MLPASGGRVPVVVPNIFVGQVSVQQQVDRSSKATTYMCRRWVNSVTASIDSSPNSDSMLTYHGCPCRALGSAAYRTHRSEPPQVTLWQTVCTAWNELLNEGAAACDVGCCSRSFSSAEASWTNDEDDFTRDFCSQSSSNICPQPQYHCSTSWCWSGIAQQQQQQQ